MAYQCGHKLVETHGVSSSRDTGNLSSLASDWCPTYSTMKKGHEYIGLVRNHLKLFGGCVRSVADLMSFN